MATPKQPPSPTNRLTDRNTAEVQARSQTLYQNRHQLGNSVEEIGSNLIIALNQCIRIMYERSVRRLPRDHNGVSAAPQEANVNNNVIQNPRRIASPSRRPQVRNPSPRLNHDNGRNFAPNQNLPQPHRRARG
jgi:hypothetical protein